MAALLDVRAGPRRRARILRRGHHFLVAASRGWARPRARHGPGRHPRRLGQARRGPFEAARIRRPAANFRAGAPGRGARLEARGRAGRVSVVAREVDPGGQAVWAMGTVAVETPAVASSAIAEIFQGVAVEDRGDARPIVYIPIPHPRASGPLAEGSRISRRIRSMAARK